METDRRGLIAKLMAHDISSNSSLSAVPGDGAPAAIGTPTDGVAMNLQTALDAIKREKFDTALDALNRAIIDASQFELAECYALRGFVRLRLEQFEHAEDDCSQSIRRRGDDPETLLWRAAARAERRHWRGAFEDLDRARNADPVHDGVYARTMENYLPPALAYFEQQLQKGHRLPQVYFERGLVYLLTREYALAGSDFESAIQHDPEHGPSLVGLARIELQRHQFAEAIRLASQALQLSPDSLTSALEVRAEAYSGSGQLSLAIEDVTRLREKVGERPEGLLTCARLRTRLGDLAGAIDDLNLASHLNPDLPVILALRGSVFAEMRNYEMALRDYSRYLNRVPGDERRWLQLGELYLKVGSLDQARDAFDRALEIDEICAAAYLGRCKVMLEISNHAQGLVESERALRLESRNPETSILRGKIFHQQGRYAQANAEFDKALHLTDDRQTLGEIHYLRGVTRLESGNAVQAIEDFKEASRLRPAHAGTHIWRAATSAKLEDWPDVIENLQAAIRLRPSAAQQYRKLGSPVAHKAVKHFDRVMREGTMTADVIRNRGRAYQFLGKNELAINDFTVALDSGSEDYDTMIERARLFARQGRLEEAIADLSKVIKKAPENDRAYFARAAALIDGKNYEAALRDIKRAIELCRQNRVTMCCVAI